MAWVQVFWLFRKLWWLIPVLSLVVGVQYLRHRVEALEAQHTADLQAVSTLEADNARMAADAKIRAEEAKRHAQTISKLEKQGAAASRQVAGLRGDSCFDRPLPPDALGMLGAEGGGAANAGRSPDKPSG